MRRPTMGNLFSGSGAWELAAKMCGIDVIFEAEIEKFPVELEAKRFPEAMQLGDVSKINGAEIPPVDILTNSSPCFARGSLVTTSEGLKDVSEVRIGDMVLTHNNRFRKVLDSSCTGTKEVYRLKAMGIDEIVCTGNHPFLVRRMKRRYPTFWIGGQRKRGNERLFLEPEWKPLSELDKTYYVGTPINQESRNVKELTREEMWLIGRYIADGYRRHDAAVVIFCIGYAKEEDFKSHLNEYHGSEDRQRTTLKYHISSKRLHDLCGDCGDGAMNKVFPAWILDLPAEDLKVVIDGYMSGDGCYKKDLGMWSASSVSRKLIYTLCQAVSKAYHSTYAFYHFKRPKTCVIEGRTVNQHDTYCTTYKTDVCKQDKAFYEDGHIWLPIRSIVPVGKEPVYNLSVEEDESYSVQNIMVHNCQNLSVAGGRTGLDGEQSQLFHEAIRITKEMMAADVRRNDHRGSDESVRLYPRPRFWCWENVPGAFSSNKGEDFRTVLESIVEIVQEEHPHISIPQGGWHYSGILDGDHFQIAWRTIDAQWEVPQRRRRIFIVADFRGHRAGEILFEQEGLPWNFKEIASAWEDTSRSLEDRIDLASRIIDGRIQSEETGMGSGSELEQKN